MKMYNGMNIAEKRPSTERRSRPEEARRKRARVEVNFFDELPDDLVLCVLSKLSASASAPSDLVNALLTCKRFNGLGLHDVVVSKASTRCLAVRANKWCDSAHRFLKRCVDAGNLDACYILGMIRFYCLQNRGSGASLMAKAAIGLNPAALYSLAVIQFNGSGGTKTDKDLRAGVALCARAASLAHVDALRELGHCLQDGYGVRRNIKEGRRLLFQANTIELTTSSNSNCSNLAQFSYPNCEEAIRNADKIKRLDIGGPLLSDYGCNLPAPEPHPANKFLADWFAARGLQGEGEGLRLCSHGGCGRPETRRHEFRRCAVCGTVNYCSRSCQALDWKLCHKLNCALLQRLLLLGANLNDGAPNEGAAIEGGVVDSTDDINVDDEHN